MQTGRIENLNFRRPGSWRDWPPIPALQRIGFAGR
jgi:hypothetical protein